MWAIATRFRFVYGERIRSLTAHGLGLAGYIVVGDGLMGAFVWFLPWSTRQVSIWERAVESMVGFVAYNVLAYTMVAAAALALLYSNEARERSIATVRLEAQLAEARLHALSAQLQPHFHFNTLNAISALVREDPATAERLLARLRELLRHSLRAGGSPTRRSRTNCLSWRSMSKCRRHASATGSLSPLRWIPICSTHVCRT